MPAAERSCVCPLPTNWELPDDLSEEIEPVLDCFYPPAPTGRPRAHLRSVLDGIILRLRSRCQWERLPERFGPRSTVHGWFQRFAQDGALAEIWHYLARGCKELGEIYRQWQAVDGVMGKSRFGGEKTQPARRWVVERTIAWLQRCRALLIRYGKKPTNYLGLIQLACALRSTTAAISAYRPPEKFSNGF